MRKTIAVIVAIIAAWWALGTLLPPVEGACISMLDGKCIKVSLH